MFGFKMKIIGKIAVLSIPILAGLMLINGSEGKSCSGPYMWTQHISNPWYVHIGNTDRHGRIRSFNRRHFGFPCWAMILDSSTTNATWYAKVDLRRFAINGLVALGIAGVLVTSLHLATKRKGAVTGEY